jgi:hypothetical protein
MKKSDNISQTNFHHYDYIPICDSLIYIVSMTSRLCENLEMEINCTENLPEPNNFKY